jgi:hypothetical protein
VTGRGASTLFVAAWALFITIVTASNVTELLHSLGIWSPVFRSGNLGFLAMATSIYGVSEGLNQLLLAGVILWEGSAALLLWRAAARLRGRVPGAIASARLALTVLGLLWFAFAIMTEVFIAYARGVNESMYWTLATAVLATLVIVQLNDAGPD